MEFVISNLIKVLNFDFMIETLTRNENIKKYKIRKLTSHQFADFLELNCQIYPSRKNIKERFQHQILSNPLLKNKSNTFILVAYSKEDKIIGQLVCNPCEYFFFNKCLSGFNICDFYVLEDYRKKGIGNSLIINAITNLKPCTLVRVTEITKGICLSNGLNIIGYLYNYFWFKSLLSVFKALGYSLFSLFSNKWIFKPKIIKDLEFLNTITTNAFTFTKINSLNEFEPSNWSNNTFVFGRTKEFIKWRFLQRQGIFQFYLLSEEKSATYFVVRKSKWRGLNIIEVVDYRVPYNDIHGFKLILQATKKLVKVLEFDAIMITSSHKFFDEILKKSLFIKGRLKDEIFLSPDIEVDIYEKAIKERDFVIATTIDLGWYGF